jgi:hypothetical protein
MAVISEPNVVTNGLILYVDCSNTRSYPGSGVTANNLIGGIGMTFMNGVGTNSANSGSFLLDGTNDYILGVHNSTFDLVNDFSANVVFKINSQGSDWVRVIGKGDITNRTFGFWYSPNQYFLFQRYGASSTVSTVYNVVPQNNVWYHIGITSNGSTHKLYFNGVDVQTQTGAGPFYSTTTPFTLGYGNVHTYLNGNIAHALLYDRALNAQEMKQNFNSVRYRFGI